MSTARWFDTDTEIEKLSGAPAKPAKVAKAGAEDEETLATLAALAGGHVETCIFDVDTEIEKLGYTPAKVAKVAKVESLTPTAKNELYGYAPAKVANPAKVEPPEGEQNFSNFSSFSRGTCVNTHFFDDTREDQAPGVLPWPCPSCGAQVRLDPSVAEELPTRFWSCAGCSTWGVAREGALAPVVWIRGGSMQ